MQHMGLCTLKNWCLYWVFQSKLTEQIVNARPTYAAGNEIRGFKDLIWGMLFPPKKILNNKSYWEAMGKKSSKCFSRSRWFVWIWKLYTKSSSFLYKKSQAQPKGELQVSPPRKLSNFPQLRRTKEVLQHGGFILVFIILRGTFRRISQLWDYAHKWNTFS